MKCCCMFFGNTTESNPPLSPSFNAEEAFEDVLEKESNKNYDLLENLLEGQFIEIIGRPLPSCSRFAVNLMCGKERSSPSDIAFHFNPRLMQRYIVRNSRLNGRWAAEETTSSCGRFFPFEHNKTFTMQILVCATEFLVLANNEEHCNASIRICSFEFRLPLSSICAVRIDGDAVDIIKINHRTIEVLPLKNLVSGPCSIAASSSIGGDLDEDKIRVPAAINLRDGFPENSELKIYGRVKVLPQYFFINLQDCCNFWPHPVILLHLNLRYSMVTGEHLFVRNAWIDGKWGREERSPPSKFQFTPGTPFTLAIRRANGHFSISLDGLLICEFHCRHSERRPQEDAVINTVYIQGDVAIRKISLS